MRTTEVRTAKVSGKTRGTKPVLPRVLFVILFILLLSGLGLGPVTAEQEPEVQLAGAPTSSASGRITLRVWDDGGAKDDEADVYFDGRYLGRSAPTAQGRTWDLGDLAPGSYTLLKVGS